MEPPPITRPVNPQGRVTPPPPLAPTGNQREVRGALEPTGESVPVIGVTHENADLYKPKVEAYFRQHVTPAYQDAVRAVDRMAMLDPSRANQIGELLARLDQQMANAADYAASELAGGMDLNMGARSTIDQLKRLAGGWRGGERGHSSSQATAQLDRLRSVLSTNRMSRETDR